MGAKKKFCHNVHGVAYKRRFLVYVQTSIPLSRFQSKKRTADFPSFPVNFYPLWMYHTCVLLAFQFYQSCFSRKILFTSLNLGDMDKQFMQISLQIKNFLNEMWYKMTNPEMCRKSPKISTLHALIDIIVF